MQRVRVHWQGLLPVPSPPAEVVQGAEREGPPPIEIVPATAASVQAEVARGGGELREQRLVIRRDLRELTRRLAQEAREEEARVQPVDARLDRRRQPGRRARVAPPRAARGHALRARVLLWRRQRLRCLHRDALVVPERRRLGAQLLERRGEDEARTLQ